jgi:glycine dehydrogenase
MAGLSHPDTFVRRHIGPRDADAETMLRALGVASMDDLVAQTIPSAIRLNRRLALPEPIAEHELLALLEGIAKKNTVARSYIGLGYSDCVTPPVILRNIVQNPGWYTQYTPYQAEISQGRLEALLNFQTMVTDLTGLDVANASLLDEGTAAAEAMHLMYAFKGSEQRKAVFVSSACHPQTIDVVRTRANPLGIDVVVGDERSFAFDVPVFGAILQYPASDGAVNDPRAFIEKAHAHGALVTIAADLLSLALLTPPGELGADVAVGSAQRFGVPLGYGGPHAAFFAAKNEFVRKLPGRIIGVSKDAEGRSALRMALQTREQHIRRERATSNVCTAQALLAIVASMYAVYHGPEGIRAIAEKVHRAASTLKDGLASLGVAVAHEAFFDTLRIEASKAQCDAWMARAESQRINLRRIDEGSLGVALDETVSSSDLDALLAVFSGGKPAQKADALAAKAKSHIPGSLARTTAYLTHPVFSSHRSETEMLRYIKTLESRDLSLTHSMIPLGSCTMKLNATVEMIPITWPEFNRLHPFAPRTQAEGYTQIFDELERYLAEITGFAAISLQPNAGSQGEYAGLLVIRAYHESRGEGQRNVCLIPSSAHGTNPASAVMAGYQVVVVQCDERGNVDVVDLEAKAQAHKDKLAALMITYPSTHGVFEEDVQKICAIVHEHGGQVYMDGANMNAQVGLCRPGDIGADVCHLNLHKTFCIPHGGGGPGMGPIGVAAHLAPFLPGHPVVKTGGDNAIGAISAAPWGSASILLISWAYIRLMGPDGLKKATEVAILNANYVAARLEPSYPIFYKGKEGRVAHECILDMRHFKKTAGIDVEDIAKRLMDYGFHAPTMSFPIPSTMMVEPTESESFAELDRFCHALTQIREEIRAIEEGKLPRDNNPLKNAPHTADAVIRTEWNHPYAREVAAFPLPYTRSSKFWPSVARIDNALGDRKLICTCPPIDAYT